IFTATASWLSETACVHHQKSRRTFRFEIRSGVMHRHVDTSTDVHRKSRGACPPSNRPRVSNILIMEASQRIPCAMRRCLIIEDDAENARYIANGFRELGYFTAISRDGLDGLQRLAGE